MVDPYFIIALLGFRLKHPLEEAPLGNHDTRGAGDVETKTETATATEIDSRKWPADRGA